MSEFKIGELIEVGRENKEVWEKRYFIMNSLNNEFVCVADYDEERFKNGQNFNTYVWKYARKIKQPEYVPFTFDDYEQLIGKAVRQLILNYVNLIVKIREGAILIGDTYYNYEELLNKFEFLDGSPCGKLK
jgi:hypothetical protein